MKKRLNRMVIVGFFGIGAFRLLISVYGLFVPLENAEIYEENHTLFRNDVARVSEYQINDILNEEISSRGLFFERLVSTVNGNIAHYWEDEGRFKYHLTVPIHENYILFTAGLFLPRLFGKHEYCDFRRALERGVGLCSQHAITICGILEERRIPCKILGLSGHVVAMAEVENDKWWILDGDYGVIVPYDIQRVEEDPSIISPYYEGDLNYSDYAMETGAFIPLQRLVEIYGKEGNIVAEGVKGYSGPKCIIETVSYYAIWVVPFFYMLPLVCVEIFRNRLPRHTWLTK